MPVLSYERRPVKRPKPRPKPRKVLPLRDVRLFTREELHWVIVGLALLVAAFVIVLTMPDPTYHVP